MSEGNQDQVAGGEAGLERGTKMSTLKERHATENETSDKRKEVEVEMPSEQDQQRRLFRE